MAGQTSLIHLLLRARSHVLTPIVPVRDAAPSHRLVVARYPDDPVVVRGAVLVAPFEPDPDPARGSDSFFGNLRNGRVFRFFDGDNGRFYIRVHVSDIRLCRGSVLARIDPASDHAQGGKCNQSSHGTPHFNSLSASGPPFTFCTRDVSLAHASVTA